MKKKKLLTLIGSICLTLVLAALLLPACAPVEVPEEIAKLEAEIADLEDDVAAEKTKTAAEKARVSDLEEQIAALKKPAEVIKIRMENNTTGGWWGRAAYDVKENLEKRTDGRIQVEVVVGEAIVPTEEQLDALRDGVFELIHGWSGYYETKIPFLKATTMVQHTLKSAADVWALVYKWGWYEIGVQEYAKYNIQPIAVFAPEQADSLYSKVNVPNWDALKGIKIRTAGFTAEVLEGGGASTVWVPLEETYTALASGLVDAATYSTPDAAYSLGWHEVTNYWIRPSMGGPSYNELIANMDFWNSLSEADRLLLYDVAMVTGTTRATFESLYNSRKTLDEVQKAGMVIIYWDDQSIKQKAEVALNLLPDFTDPAAVKAKDLLIDYIRFVGYID